MIPDVVERLRDQARRHGALPAVFEGGTTLSYADILGRAEGLAERLCALGPHPRVAILLPQGADAYIAMFATLLAGGYYLPANRDSVADKTNRILAEFQPDILLARPEDVGALALPPGLAVWSDTTIPASGPLPPRPPHRLAYVIFTSGSTGRPKGVMIPRDALNHYTAWALESLAPGPGDRWSQHPNIGFDLSVLDIFGALCSGACLYPLLGEMDRMLPGRFIARHGLTIWNSVPSVMDMMAKAGDITADRLGSLRLLTFCGEPLYPAQVEAIFLSVPLARVQNTYGPTEATVSCTVLALGPATLTEACDGTVALGAAIPGMALHRIESEDGIELAISGPQLADGYWQDDERTAQAFRTLVIGGRPVRAYATGDIVRERRGQLYFQRRRDTQVKIRGYRLELDEINSAIRALGVAAAATVLVGGRLHSFISGPGLPEPERIRAELERRLDPHAVPGYIHALADLPRNANDKIDLGVLERLAAEQEPP